MRISRGLSAVAVGACVAALSFTACNDGGAGGAGGGMDFRHDKDGKGTPVATFNGDRITVEELQQRFGEMSPFARARFQTLQQKKEYVEGLANFELLAHEALAQGLQNDPDVVETAKKVMVQKLIQKEFDQKGQTLPDSEVKAYYDKHVSDYVKPEMVRLSDLFLAAPASDAAARAAKEKQAEALVKQARALAPMDFNGFGKLVEQSSEDPKTKVLKGDLRYLSNDALAQKYGAPLVDAAKKLTQVGQVSDVVATDQGFHVVKLQGRQAALNLSVDQVKTQIQQRLLYERRNQHFRQFLEQLAKKSDFKVDDATLSKLTIDMNAPAKEPKGPPPGYIPPPPTAGPTE